MTVGFLSRSGRAAGCAQWLLLAIVALGAGSLREANAQVTEEPVSLAVVIQQLTPDVIRAVQQNKLEVIQLGAKFDMSCHIKPGGDPKANVRWLKDNMPLPQRAATKLTGWLDRVLFQDYQIRFLNFSLIDAGYYKCITDQGTVHANLTVRPVSTNLTRRVTAFEGDPVNLQCDAIGFPTPNFTWTDPQNVPIATPANNTLSIERALPTHNGTYRCAAKNAVGNTTVKIELLVMERLRFTNTSYHTKIIASDGHFDLWCFAASRPTPKVIWFFKPQGGDRRPLNRQGPVLRMNAATANNEGNYTCQVHSFLPCCAVIDAQPWIEKSFEVKSRNRNQPNDNGQTNTGDEPTTKCIEPNCDSGASHLSSFSTTLLLLSSLLSLLFFV